MKQQYQHRCNHRNDHRDHEKLTGRTRSLPFLSAADILTDNNCTAGGQCRKQENQYGIK